MFKSVKWFFKVETTIFFLFTYTHKKKFFFFSIIVAAVVLVFRICCSLKHLCVNCFHVNNTHTMRLMKAPLAAFFFFLLLFCFCFFPAAFLNFKLCKLPKLNDGSSNRENLTNGVFFIFVLVSLFALIDQHLMRGQSDNDNRSLVLATCQRFRIPESATSFAGFLSRRQSPAAETTMVVFESRP